MKRICCLIITILILITSIGCNNSTQKEKEQVLTSNGYILDVWEDKDIYNNAIFYNPETEEYSKIIIDNIDKYSNDNEIYNGNNLYFIKIIYTIVDENIIVSDIKPIKEYENTKRVQINDNEKNVALNLKSLINFNHSKESPADFVDLAHFFFWYNSDRFLIGETVIHNDRDYMVYNADNFLKKLKEFVPDINETDIYKLKELNEYDEKNNCVYADICHVGPGFGWNTYALKYKKLDNNIINATVVEIDDTHIPIEYIYEYKLNTDNSICLISSKSKVKPVLNFVPKKPLEYIQYFSPLTNTTILFQPWKSPNDIPVDTMLEFMSYHYQCEYYKYWDKDDLTHKVPFDVFYDNCKKHFDVSEKYIKSFNEYNKENNCIEHVFGGTNSYSYYPKIEIDNVIANNDVITITFYIYEFNDSNTKKQKYKYCKLIMQKTYNDGFKYLSFEYN